MVSSQLPALSKTTSVQSSHLFFPVNLPSDDVEMDFSDVFGPLPVEASTGVSNVMELVAEADPVDDYNQQTHHSLVSPPARVSPCSMMSKLAIHDTEGSRELEEEIGTDKTVKQVGKLLVTDDDIVEESPDVNSMKIQRVGVEDFEVIQVVGQGAFGKVFQVRKRGTSEIYAMKVMRKDKIVNNNHAEYMKAERDILAKIRHPFIVALRHSFQTKYRLYLVLDFVNGGHLLFHLYNNGLFREDLARIYTAEIVSAVSYLHANGVMHRDLKPENILLDADGHAMLTDFGLAKQFEENARSNSMCGTVEYMSPEIVSRKGHDKAADWWSVGILLFEMLTGKLPFTSANREKTQRKIMNDKIKLPGFLTSEAHSLLKGLLQKDPSKRLGSGPCGSDEVKSHKWFKEINWKKLEAREIQPSFRPEVAGKHCVAYFDKHWTDMPLQDSPASSPKTDIDPFQGFPYDRPDPACSLIS